MKSMVKKTGYFIFFSILHTVKYEARPVHNSCIARPTKQVFKYNGSIEQQSFVNTLKNME